MVYKVIGMMSGSSLDGLDIAFVDLQENGGQWSYEILAADCYEYNPEWIDKLKNATALRALDYQLLHVEYGHYLGREVNHFIEKNELHHKVALVASHGHTTFHVPPKMMTAQLGDGASIAAETGLPVVSDLRSMDMAFGGEGAPIVPIGEKLLLGDHTFFLNLGGIANLSVKDEQVSAFDICAANRVLNMIAAEKGEVFDRDGNIAAAGQVNNALLEKLNGLAYYQKPFPKSLANDFGTDTVYPMVKAAGLSSEDAMRTYVEHIVLLIKESVNRLRPGLAGGSLLATGGGALNLFMVQRLEEALKEIQVTVNVPDHTLVQYKEAVIMALIGTLRWREEYNVLASVTGAKRNSIGGALWLGTEA